MMHSSDTDAMSSNAEQPGTDTSKTKTLGRSLFRKLRGSKDAILPKSSDGKSTVQLLHGSVKDFFEDTSKLDILASACTDDPQTFIHQHNGHCLILSGILFFMKLGRIELSWHWEDRARHAIMFHARHSAPYAGLTLFKTLDSIDEILSDKFDDHWAQMSTSLTEVQRWHLTLTAFAVAHGLSDYVRHRLQRDPSLCQDDGSRKRSLLHYAVSAPFATSAIQPGMVRMLLEFGAHPLAIWQWYEG